MGDCVDEGECGLTCARWGGGGKAGGGGEGKRAGACTPLARVLTGIHARAFWCAQNVAYACLGVYEGVGGGCRMAAPHTITPNPRTPLPLASPRVPNCNHEDNAVRALIPPPTPPPRAERAIALRVAAAPRTRPPTPNRSALPARARRPPRATHVYCRILLRNPRPEDALHVAAWHARCV